MARKGTNLDFGLNVDGVQQLSAALRRLSSKAAREYMTEAIKGAVAFIHAELLDTVPVRTGKMRKAIASGKLSSTAAEARGYVWIKKKGGYQAHLVEYGHNKYVRDRLGRKVFKGFKGPEPFFRPVIDNNETLILAIFQRKLERLLSEAGAL